MSFNNSRKYKKGHGNRKFICLNSQCDCRKSSSTNSSTESIESFTDTISTKTSKAKTSKNNRHSDIREVSQTRSVHFSEPSQTSDHSSEQEHIRSVYSTQRPLLWKPAGLWKQMSDGKYVPVDSVKTLLKTPRKRLVSQCKSTLNINPTKRRKARKARLVKRVYSRYVPSVLRKPLKDSSKMLKTTRKRSLSRSKSTVNTKRKKRRKARLLKRIYMSSKSQYGNLSSDKTLKCQGNYDKQSRDITSKYHCNYDSQSSEVSSNCQCLYDDQSSDMTED